MSMAEAEILNSPFAIIAEPDLVLGFKALGFKTYVVKTKEELDFSLDEIIQQRIAICLVQDNIYSQGCEKLNHYRTLPMPIFIPFAKNEKKDILDNIVKDIRLRATGTF